jgi:hypothetical protein
VGPFLFLAAVFVWWASAAILLIDAYRVDDDVRVDDVLGLSLIAVAGPLIAGIIWLEKHPVRYEGFLGRVVLRRKRS